MNDNKDKIFVSVEVEKRYRKFLKACRLFLQKEDLKDIRQAFKLVLNSISQLDNSDKDQFLINSLDISIIVAEEIGLQKNAVLSSLLYNAVTKGYIQVQTITDNFDGRISDIIIGLVKLDGIATNTNSDQVENFRKLLLSLVSDVRVILIKLAEMLHIMRHLDRYSDTYRNRIALDCFHLYSPLAHRLGLYNLKTEMEDLSLKQIQPEQYFNISQKLSETTALRNKFIKDFIQPIKEELTNQGFDYSIKARTKSIYSIFRKMHKQNVPFEEVYDLFAIRIILNSAPDKEKSDCWRAFSIVTDFYQPNPLRMRDWISVPKSNGYESLHTTVVVPGGKWVEVQIRTVRMDEIAEKGLAAHWKYKGGQEDTSLDKWLGSVREVLSSPETDNTEVLDSIKLNLSSKEIFIFTPKGDLRKLPVDATVLDFAFDIHSNVGCACTGAKVNGRNVPIKHILQNGDKVEIITSKGQKPKKDWLSIVKTSKAKAKIKSVLKEEAQRNTEVGKEILQRKCQHWKINLDDTTLKKLIKGLGIKSVTEIYSSIAEEKISLATIKELLFQKEEQSRTTEKINESIIGNLVKKQDETSSNDCLIIDENISNLNYTLAPCCRPVYGDAIFGFVTIDKGIRIHRETCPNATDMKKRFGYRVVKAKWSKSDGKTMYAVDLHISGINDVGLLSRVTDVLSKEDHVQMRSLSVNTDNDVFEGTLSILVSDVKQLDSIINKIKKIKGINHAERNMY